MRRRDLALLGLLFLLAFGLRFYDLGYPAFQWADETGHVPAASHYWSDGQFLPDFWEHPPLRHVLLNGFLRVLGDNPYGWRMRNVLFGALAAVLTALLAHAVSGSRRAAAMAGLLLATDPLHVVLSRYTFEEIYGGAFFVGAIVLYVLHRQRSHWLALSAVLMGCALATKWYYVPAWLLVYLLALREGGAWRVPRTALFITSTWLLIPLAVYVAAYLPWFGRGYSVAELVELNVNAYHSLQSLTTRSYPPGMGFLRHTSSLEWFTRPVVVGQGADLGQGRGEFILYVNDWPVWVLTLPSMVAVTVLAVRRRTLVLALPVLLFVGTWSLFLVVERPAFLYSAVPLLPFAFTAIACTVSHLSLRFGPRLHHAVLALALAWNAYLYPLVTAKKVPTAAYRLILDDEDISVR